MSEKIPLSTTRKIRIDEYLQKELPSALQRKFSLEESNPHNDEFSYEKNSLNQKNSSLCSNSKIRRLIVSGQVFVNGKAVTRPSFELRGKSLVVINFDKEKFFYEKQPGDIVFKVKDEDVLYEDDNLIFINKPAFFPVEQTITGNRDNLHDKVVDYLWKKNPSLRNPPYVGIMHRLDRETSGVILFTKNRDINKIITQMFSAHKFTKKYLALCQKKSGFKVGDWFTVEMEMGRISCKSRKGKWGKVPGGQFSKTDFYIAKEILVDDVLCFLVECTLFTGRTHQIRVHLSSRGLPVLGDDLYGGRSAKRIYLHALQLKAELEELEFDVKAPEIFWENR